MATDVTSTKRTPSPHINKVLENATADLKNAEFPGYLGKLFNPIRELLLIPIAIKATDMVPKVVDAIPLPFLDEVGAFAMSVPFGTMKLTYTIIPHKEVDDESNNAITHEFKRRGENGMRKLKPNEPNPITSSLMGIYGFATNTILDLAALPFNGHVGKWTGTVMELFGFLLCSGIGEELVTAYGNPRGIQNLLIIGNAQAKDNGIGCEGRRARVAMDSLPPGMTTEAFKLVLKDAARYVRYATAAYGISMIDSADLLQVFGKDIVRVPAVQKASEDFRKRKIAKYVGIEEDQIIIPPVLGGNIALLGHFVAVDRRATQVDKSKGAVVLAIRGTYTISGILVDATAFAKDFCAGKAHTGMAKQVDLLWESIKGTVVRELKKNSGYDLVISGHSLGAGCAALLALKLNYEKLLEKEDSSLSGVKVKCFAFAPPPVYTTDSKDNEVYLAMKNTYSFVHENDCVPFLSADAVRRLTKTVTEVNKKSNLFTRPFIAAGLKDVPQDIVNIVVDGAVDLESVDRAERLAIPSPFVVWFRDVNLGVKGPPQYDAMICRPKSDGSARGINDLSILIDWDMISDHMNPQYERAINSVLGQIIRKKVPGYVFPICKA